eukprot:3352986-Amphidinium_carterae.1
MKLATLAKPWLQTWISLSIASTVVKVCASSHMQFRRGECQFSTYTSDQSSGTCDLSIELKALAQNE